MDLNYYNHEQSNRVYSNNYSSPSLTTKSDNARGVKILIKNANSKGYLEATPGDGIDLLQPNSETRRGRVQKGTIQTLDTMGGNGKGVIVDE